MGEQMTDKQKKSSSKIKIKRTRKRLYETESQDSVATADRPDPNLPTTLQTKAESKVASANRIINRYVVFSAGTALVPLPIVNMISMTAIELRMLKRLSDHYDLTFSEQKGKALIGSLLGGFHAGLFTKSLLRTVPIIGLVGAVVPIGVLAGALTYALGKVFVHHFETGGTLLDFDSGKFQSFFGSKLKEGKKVASTPHKNARRR